MIDGLYQVSTRYFTAGFTIKDDRIISCAPILRKKIDYWKTIAMYIPPADDKILIVAGSRDFLDKEFIFAELDKIPSIKTIISGLAKGPDTVGKLYAQVNGLPCIAKAAEWKIYGNSAGYIRNAEMAAIATHCICFWDGKSKGTKHMIDLCKKYKVRCKVFMI